MSFAQYLPLMRLSVMGWVCVTSVVVLAMAAHLINFTSSVIGPGSYFDFAALSLATAVLSLLTLPAFIFIDKKRKGAFTSMIVVELGWLGFLWIMWLASAGSTAGSIIAPSSCSGLRGSIGTACAEVQVIEAFGFINWLAIMFYFIVLLTFSFIAQQNGNTQIWSSSVKDTDFNAPRTTAPQHSHAEKDLPAANPNTMQYPPAAAPAQVPTSAQV